jgi:hypothetical protein
LSDAQQNALATTNWAVLTLRWQQAGGAPGGFNWEDWVTQSQGPGGVRVEYGDLNDIFGEGGFSDFFTQILAEWAVLAHRRAGQLDPLGRAKCRVSIDIACRKLIRVRRAPFRWKTAAWKSSCQPGRKQARECEWQAPHQPDQAVSAGILSRS